MYANICTVKVCVCVAASVFRYPEENVVAQSLLVLSCYDHFIQVCISYHFLGEIKIDTNETIVDMGLGYRAKIIEDRSAIYSEECDEKYVS